MSELEDALLRCNHMGCLLGYDPMHWCLVAEPAYAAGVNTSQRS